MYLEAWMQLHHTINLLGLTVLLYSLLFKKWVAGPKVTFGHFERKMLANAYF